MKTKNGQVIETKPTSVEIILNGRTMRPSKQILDYDELEFLAGAEFHGVGISTVDPNRLATISYTWKEDHGSVAPGQSLILEDGMVVNIART